MEESKFNPETTTFDEICESVFSIPFPSMFTKNNTTNNTTNKE